MLVKIFLEDKIFIKLTELCIGIAKTNSTKNLSKKLFQVGVSNYTHPQISSILNTYICVGETSDDSEYLTLEDAHAAR